MNKGVFHRWPFKKGFPSENTLTNLRRTVFSLRAPMQPAKPRINITPPTTRNSQTGSNPPKSVMEEMFESTPWQTETELGPIQLYTIKLWDKRVYQKVPKHNISSKQAQIYKYLAVAWHFLIKLLWLKWSVNKSYSYNQWKAVELLLY